MLQNVYQPERTFPGAIGGRGPIWPVPELRCPGVVWQPLEVYLEAERALPKITLEDGEARRLTLAMFGRALRDARSKDPLKADLREDAAAWLKSGEAAAWLSLCGARIRQPDIDNWLARCAGMVKNAELAPKKKKAVEALLTSRTLGEACEAAKISRTTLTRWLEEPLFNQALKSGAAASLEELTRSLVTLGEKAVKTLGEALDGDSPMQAGARVRAADIILGRLLQLREAVDLEERLSVLEAAYGNKK